MNGAGVYPNGPGARDPPVSSRLAPAGMHARLPQKIFATQKLRPSKAVVRSVIIENEMLAAELVEGVSIGASLLPLVFSTNLEKW
jgi:hypothetical protein